MRSLITHGSRNRKILSALSNAQLNHPTDSIYQFQIEFFRYMFDLLDIKLNLDNMSTKN